jgi:hypothetical protein
VVFWVGVGVFFSLGIKEEILVHGVLAAFCIHHYIFEFVL